MTLTPPPAEAERITDGGNAVWTLTAYPRVYGDFWECFVLQVLCFPDNFLEAFLKLSIIQIKLGMQFGISYNRNSYCRTH